MKKKLTFLGIETSCDETAASIVREKTDGTGEILSNIVSSQVEEHKEFGGVVPEIAARAHVEKIEHIVKKAVKESNFDINNLDGVAATAGPGLIVCLTVGLNIGKAIAGSLKKPFIAVNHLEGHALSPKINKKIPVNKANVSIKIGKIFFSILFSMIFPKKTPNKTIIK